MGLENFILTCEKDNEELRKDVNYYKNMASRLKKENEKLKKQLEKDKNKYIKKVNNFLAEDVEPDPEDLYMAELEQRAMDCELMEMQQKEFIKYLEKRYKDVTSVIGSFGSNTDLLYGKKDMIEEIIQKYKRIIGDNK